MLICYKFHNNKSMHYLNKFKVENHYKFDIHISKYYYLLFTIIVQYSTVQIHYSRLYYCLYYYCFLCYHYSL
jgi:hypothetical protein